VSAVIIRVLALALAHLRPTVWLAGPARPVTGLSKDAELLVLRHGYLLAVGRPLCLCGGLVRPGESGGSCTWDAIALGRSGSPRASLGSDTWVDSDWQAWWPSDLQRQLSGRSA